MGNFKITGTIKDIKDTQRITDKFSKREVWVNVEDDPKYPQTLSIEFTNKGCATLDNFHIGQEVNITFSLRGREYKDKIYNSLNGFQIDLVGKPTGTATPVKQGEMSTWQAKEPVNTYADGPSPENDDLPF